MTPRIPLLSLDEAKAAAAGAGVSELAAELSVFRVWLHHPKLARWLSDMLMGLLWDGRLDPRLRELVIMRLGWATRSDYEWTQHWKIAVDGLHIPAEDILGVRTGSSTRPSVPLNGPSSPPSTRPWPTAP